MLGLLELHERNFAQASALFEESLAVTPDVHAFTRLASSRYFEGRLEPALQAAEAALRMDGAALDAHLARAAALHGLDRFDEALAAASEAVRLDPRNPLAVARAGSALERLGRMAEADRMFRRAADLTGANKAYSLVSFDAGVLDQIRSSKGTAVRQPMARLEPTHAAPPSFVVLVSCDAKYFVKYGFNFVNALARNAREASVLHLHLLDGDADSDAMLGRVVHEIAPGNLRVTTEVSSFGAGANVAAHTYYSCARFLQLPALLDQYQCPVISIDVDAIVERPLGDLVSQVQGDAGLVRRRPSHSPWLEIPAGLVIAMPSPRGRSYFELVRNYVLLFMRRGQFRWHLDQAALYCVLRMLEASPARTGLLGALRKRLSGSRALAAPRVTWIPEGSLAGIWQIGHEYDASLGDPRFTRYSPP
jgi:tetratricopeptide (TPR) repeat protein